MRARHGTATDGLEQFALDIGIIGRQRRIAGQDLHAGRRDIRGAMVETAHTAVRSHPHWQAELERLEPRLGKNKAIVAIARKLLVTVWHVLTEGCADRFADPEQVARKLLKRGNFTSVEDLIAKVLDFIDYYNRTMAKPFKWTYKGKALAA